MKKLIFPLFFVFLFITAFPQQKDSLISFRMYDDVIVSMDIPINYQAAKKTLLILYALPNGNSTAQTMGKKINIDDDWRFDIQHIKAQTDFIRNELKEKNKKVLNYINFTEKEFNIQIPDDQAEKITTVGHAIAYIEEVVNK